FLATIRTNWFDSPLICVFPSGKSTSNRTVQFSQGLILMSSHSSAQPAAPLGANRNEPNSEVHPFPNVKATPETDKTAPAVEAPPAHPAPAAPTVAEAPAKQKKRSARSFILPILLLTLAGGGSWYGYKYWTDGRFLISTDDAYVRADMASVAPKISGYV